ncbi:MAG: TIGR04283 family arsenosugar biosynthesis glycosyltransferase [Acidobacteria bacterium]|nr:TIGR04283 family arsenosugar biosynthesis glycosyltransferase [Acidobacteriota bacterium]
MSIVISVVIPVWRDTEPLLTLLAHLPARPDVEVIVAATDDEYQEIAAALEARPGVRVVAGRRGRGAQMNAGAAAASGAWLLFLHADSQLPPGALDEIALLSSDPHTVGGAFQFALDAPGWRPRVMEWGTAQRTRWFHLPYGDQGIFVRRTIFERLGGYSASPLMEDVGLIRRLRRVGRLHRSTLKVVTSARRWHRDGWFRRMGHNWMLMILYGLGVGPRRLARRYEGRSRSVVAVLARAPSSGGKSRLFQSLGIEPDPALTTALLSDTLSAIERAPRVDRALIYTPAGSRPEIESATRRDWTYIAQCRGDLGDRMAAAFQDLHGLGYDEIVLVGSDLPTLPPALISRALRGLRRRTPTVVLGPSADGGYFLIALRRPVDELFREVAWSTPAVLDQTRARAAALGLSVHLIDEWYDVDDVESLERASRESDGSQVAAWWRTRGAPLG